MPYILAVVVLWGFAVWLTIQIHRWLFNGVAQVRGITARRGDGPDYWIITAYFSFGAVCFFSAAIVSTHHLFIDPTGMFAYHAKNP